MPYFERKDTEEYRRQFDQAADQGSWEEAEDSYDDGFDELLADPQAEEAEEEPLTEEEEEALRQARKRRFRIAAGVGDLGGILIGTALILVLVAFLISMIRYVSSDFSRTFSLWQTRF